MKLDGRFTAYLFENYLTGKKYSVETKKRYMREVRDFMIWLGNKDLRDAGSEEILSYLKYLFESGKYSESTRSGIKSTLSMLFKYLTRNDYILFNPFSRLDLKIMRDHKERDILSIYQMNKLLDGIGIKNMFHLRDRCLFELMYGTGIRVGELVNLDVTDLDLNNNELLVRQGKGNKDRILPIGNNVVSYLKLYLSKSRKKLVKGVKKTEVRKALFISYYRRRITIDGVEKSLNRWCEKTGVKKISPHVIRHSFASHLLENGAGIKHVKEILGHKSIKTTVIYTHLDVMRLKKIMKKYHPRENELYEEIDKEKLKKKIDKFGISH